MNVYGPLAGSYDALTGDVDYEAYARFCLGLFAARGVHVRSVADLACGTGALGLIFAGMGYDVTGVDVSPDMLSEAVRKAYDLPEEQRPLFVCQDLRELDLYGASDAAVCALDGFNYIPGEDLQAVFYRLYNFIEPGGILIFDLNTPEKLRSMDGEVYLDETEDSFCVWRGELDGDCCHFGYDLFVSRGDLWERSREEHTEYLHEPDTVRRMLEQAGYTEITCYDGKEAGFAEAEGMRIFFCAGRPDK